MRLLITTINLALSVLISQSAFAGDFSYTKEELAELSEPLLASSKQVTRWCNSKDSTVIYGNMANEGYYPCGTLQPATQCDATGQKYLGTGKAPHGFLNCDIGPRIQVLKGGKALVNSQYIEYARGLSSEVSYSTFSSKRPRSKQERYFDQLDKLLESR